MRKRQIRCALGHHRGYAVAIGGHYHSITGPRTIVKYRCNYCECGTWTDAIQGLWYKVEDLNA